MIKLPRIGTAFFLSCLLAALFSHNCDAQPGTGPQPVVVGNVLKSKQTSEKSFVGTLRPIRRAVIGSAVEGRVRKVNFRAGDYVGGDQSGPLVELVTGTLDIEIGLAEIKIRLAKQKLEELQLAIPNEIELAKTRLSELEAQLEYSRANFQRLQTVGSNAIAELELDAAASAFESNRQQVENAKIQLANSLATKQVRLAQAETQVAVDQQELARLKDLREKYTIESPFKGVVADQQTEIGAWLSRGDPVAEVVQLDPVELVINVPQQYTTRLLQTIEQTIDVKFEGIDEDFQGQVKRVVPQMDLLSRTLPVRIEIGNKRGPGEQFLLQPGMLAQARMKIGDEREMLLVKKDALVLGGRQVTVYKIVQNSGQPVATPVPVKTGAEIGEWVEVSGSLTDQDQVVLMGNERLRPGQPVKITETRNEEIQAPASAGKDS